MTSHPPSLDPADLPDELEQVSDDDSTDLAVFHTWPRVYAFVLGTFIVWVALLTLLSRAFS
jgi:hypothetical protein